MVRTYRKRAMLLKAVQYAPDDSNQAEVVEFVGGPANLVIGDKDLLGPTITVPPGTWIIKDPDGAISFCRDEVFYSKYEPVEAQD